MFHIRNLNNIDLIEETLTNGVEFRPDSALAKLTFHTGAVEAETTAEVLAIANDNPYHEAMMVELSNDITRVGLDRINIIRNRVVGDIEEIFGKVGPVLQSVLPVNQTAQLRIQKVPSIFNSEFFASSAEQYATSPQTPIKLGSASFPQFTSVELLELLNHIDDSEVRSMVAELVDATPVPLHDIYNKHFRDILATDYPTATTQVAPSYIRFRHLEAATVYLLAQAFKTTVNANVNMPLSEYNLKMAQKTSHAGRMLHGTLNLMTVDARRNKNGRIYLGGVQTQTGITDIIVSEVGLAKWLELGNTIEQILGCVWAGQESSLNGTIEPTEKSLVAWSEVHRKKTMITGSELATVRRAVAAKEITKGLHALIDNVDFDMPSNHTPDTLKQRCKEVIMGLGPLDLGNLYAPIQAVVAKGIYAELNAFEFLRSMEIHQRENPNLKPREAATLATRDFIVEYCVNQFV